MTAETVNLIRNPTSQVKAVFDEVFKYRIGDLVNTKTILEAYKLALDLQTAEARRYEPAKLPYAMIVLERAMTECHGGIQMNYLIGHGESNQNMKVTEFELVPYEEVAAVARKFRAEPADK